MSSQHIEFRSAKDANLAWRESAACRSADVGLFFPGDDTTDVAVERIEAAKSVCNSCPAQGACLQYALETKQEDGIWGGTTETERRRLRRAWLAGRRRLVTVA